MTEVIVSHLFSSPDAVDTQCFRSLPFKVTLRNTLLELSDLPHTTPIPPPIAMNDKLTPIPIERFTTFLNLLSKHVENNNDSSVAAGVLVESIWSHLTNVVAASAEPFLLVFPKFDASSHKAMVTSWRVFTTALWSFLHTIRRLLMPGVYHTDCYTNSVLPWAMVQYACTARELRDVLVGGGTGETIVEKYAFYLGWILGESSTEGGNETLCHLIVPQENEAEWKTLIANVFVLELEVDILRLAPYLPSEVALVAEMYAPSWRAGIISTMTKFSQQTMELYRHPGAATTSKSAWLHVLSGTVQEVSIWTTIVNILKKKMAASSTDEYDGIITALVASSAPRSVEERNVLVQVVCDVFAITNFDIMENESMRAAFTVVLKKWGILFAVWQMYHTHIAAAMLGSTGNNNSDDLFKGYQIRAAVLDRVKAVTTMVGDLSCTYSSDEEPWFTSVVLTSSAWPTVEVEPIAMPSAVLRARQNITALYLKQLETNSSGSNGEVSKKPKKKLIWSPLLDKVTLRATLLSGVYDIHVSGATASCLMSFNANDFYTRKEFKDMFLSSSENIVDRLLMCGLLRRRKDGYVFNDVFALSIKHRNPTGGLVFAKHGVAIQMAATSSRPLWFQEDVNNVEKEIEVLLTSSQSDPSIVLTREYVETTLRNRVYRAGSTTELVDGVLVSLLLSKMQSEGVVEAESSPLQ
eukprot:PhF_6_TR13944/c0_g1_i3/m.22430